MPWSNILLPFAKRFVAGAHQDQAIEAVKELNKLKLLATLDVLGEDVHDPEGAKTATKSYLDLLAGIEHHGVDANVSLKLSQMGLVISDKLAYDNICVLMDEARRLNNFVRIDMEGSNLTDKTLATFWRLRDQGYDNVGVVLQMYLYRTEKDIDKIIEKGGSVRLCKGAYKEPESIAWQNMADIRKNFVEQIEKIFRALKNAGSNVYPAIATHDDNIISETKRLQAKYNIDRSAFEFQLLYGMRQSLAVQLAAEGYKVRSYVPFGIHWFPYFYRRIRERKENLYFVLKNILKN